jgi:hypothetical protein
VKDLLRALRDDLGELTQEQDVHIDWQPARPSPQPSTPESGESPVAHESSPLTDSIELHTDAKRNFDAKAESIFGLLRTAPLDEERPEPSEVPEGAKPIVTELPPHAIRDDTLLFRDHEGVITARLFEHDGSAIGLDGPGYQRLRKLAEDMQRTQALKSIVALDTVEQLVFEWIRSRVTGATSEPMTKVVLAQLEQRIATFEVILPLFKVQLSEPIQIGRVTLRTITSSDFARWEAAAFGKASPALPMLLAFMKERKRMQGFAAAVCVLRGENERVLDAALEEAEQAVGMLRLFAPAILSPRARSFCAVEGRELVEAPAYLLHDPTRATVHTGRFMDTPLDTAWRLDSNRIALIRRQALDALLERLIQGKPTPFAVEIRSALVLYSQSALRTRPVDKLLAILLPLESFLLRDSRESITENIAMRFALTVGEDFEERKRIRSVAQEVYGMRSAYLHHRRPIEGIDQLKWLREFMEYAWRFFILLGVHVVTRFQDRPQFLAHLDDLKLGAPAID